MVGIMIEHHDLYSTGNEQATCYLAEASESGDDHQWVLLVNGVRFQAGFFRGRLQAVEKQNKHGCYAHRQSYCQSQTFSPLVCKQTCNRRSAEHYKSEFATLA
ncbi:hypothetical protein D3C78_1278390 [compost metagenome]